MKIHILEEKGNHLKFELEGNHNMNMLCNALNMELWQDANVSAAGFHQEHPLTNKYKFVLETKKGGSPREVIEAAVKRVQKQADEFSKKVASAL